MARIKQPLLIITSGEPAGIGPDLVTCINPGDFRARLVLLGDRELLEKRAKLLKSSINFTPFKPQANKLPSNSLEVIHMPLARPCQAGMLDQANAEYVLDMLTRATKGCLQNEFDGMVTAPIQKDIINQAGTQFSGHTEFLANICGAEKPLMLLTAGTLRVALVTTHLPLRNVAEAITSNAIQQIVEILHHDLKLKYGFSRPHIKVCGLNPHAGESGYLGTEEIDIINPAIKQLKQRGIKVSGPYPADTVFTQESLKDADVILAMYHDQGLPVLKHAGFNRGVNTTLGLPIIRTSVDHGTALSLAGTGQASPGSLFAAINSAISQFNFLNHDVSAA